MIREPHASDVSVRQLARPAVIDRIHRAAIKGTAGNAARIDQARRLAAIDSAGGMMQAEAGVGAAAVDLEAFAGFLRRAEEYDRTGVLPVVIKPAPRTRTGSAPKQISDISAIRDEVKQLYVRAGSAGTQEIDAMSKKLQPLKKDELVEIARAIDLVGVEKKTKADILNQVVNRIRSIQQSAVRTAIIERPGTAY